MGDTSRREPSEPATDDAPRATIARMLNGAWIAQVVSAVTRLSVPDTLQQHGPLTARELTERGVEAKPEFLERALRACASVGVFTEDSDGRFEATALSEVLTSSSAHSIKQFAELYGGRWWNPWGGLLDALQTGEPQRGARRDADASAFALEPQEIERFGRAMQGNLALLPGLLEHCDLSDVKTLVDVGGGFGHMAIGLLRGHPQLRATVLDLPAVVNVAQQHIAREAPDVADRLAFAGEDMFEDVPEGDAFLLSRILHDWDDARCLRVLQHCRARIRGAGPIIALDAVLPPLGDASGLSAKLLDLNMMVLVPGKERTEVQWRALFDQAALDITSIVMIDTRTCVSVIQGRRR